MLLGDITIEGRTRIYILPPDKCVFRFTKSNIEQFKYRKVKSIHIHNDVVYISIGGKYDR